MANPVVSVIVPVFNRSDLLRQALQSAEAQTYTPMETIVVDDGSTEDIASVVAAFPQARYLRQSKQGPSAARNHAIAESVGDHLAFLDSDDLWHPEKIARQMDHMQRASSIDIVYTRAENFLEEGCDCPSHLSEQDFGTSIPCIMTMLVRRSSFDKIGEFARDLTHGEDTDWIMRARDTGLEEHTIDEVLMSRRIHDSNLSSNLAQSRENALQILRQSILRKRAQGQNDNLH